MTIKEYDSQYSPGIRRRYYTWRFGPSWWTIADYARPSARRGVSSSIQRKDVPRAFRRLLVHPYRTGPYKGTETAYFDSEHSVVKVMHALEIIAAMETHEHV